MAAGAGAGTGTSMGWAVITAGGPRIEPERDGGGSAADGRARDGWRERCETWEAVRESGSVDAAMSAGRSAREGPRERGPADRTEAERERGPSLEDSSRWMPATGYSIPSELDSPSSPSSCSCGELSVTKRGRDWGKKERCGLWW